MVLPTCKDGEDSEDRIHDVSQLSEIYDAINECDELTTLMNVLYSLGKLIKDKFPTATIKLTRDRHLQDPEEIEYGG